jgi:hypothetical protein
MRIERRAAHQSIVPCDGPACQRLEPNSIGLAGYFEQPTHAAAATVCLL